MGYAAGYERLWQIHLSCAYANGEAAALLGERFVTQDALQRAFNVNGLSPRPANPGDWVASVSRRTECICQFTGRNTAGICPCGCATAAIYTGRYCRPVSFYFLVFLHKSWSEKILLGRLMATHGVECSHDHVLHFSDADRQQIQFIRTALRNIDPRLVELAYPEVAVPDVSGSNNWAVTADRSVSGYPILATDPHQPHSIPNTFFYVHLHAGDWDAFGAAFPGVPYFMMGFTNQLAWGLTTGFVDCYDVFVEQLAQNQYRTADGWQPIEQRTEIIGVKGGEQREVNIRSTQHGVLLEPLMQELESGR